MLIHSSCYAKNRVIIFRLKISIFFKGYGSVWQKIFKVMLFIGEWFEKNLIFFHSGCVLDRKNNLRAASNFMIQNFSFFVKIWQLVMQPGVNITLPRFCMSLISQINKQSLIWNKQTERANLSLKEFHEKHTRRRKTEPDRHTHAQKRPFLTNMWCDH